MARKLTTTNGRVRDATPDDINNDANDVDGDEHDPDADTEDETDE